jgi:hypothetical protein
MNPLIVSASAEALVFGGACLGLHLHRIQRPEHVNLVAWMFAIFVSFGPKTPRNYVVYAAFTVYALAICSSIFVIPNSVFVGAPRIPSKSVRTALAHMLRPGQCIGPARACPLIRTYERATPVCDGGAAQLGSRLPSVPSCQWECAKCLGST